MSKDRYSDSDLHAADDEAPLMPAPDDDEAPLVPAPDVVDLPEPDALRVLADNGLGAVESEEENTDVNPGRVLRQDPAAGGLVRLGGAVALVISKLTPHRFPGPAVVDPPEVVQ